MKKLFYIIVLTMSIASCDVMGVGDFSGDIQKQTVIYARKKKWGNYLKSYFANPVVKQAPALTNGADIEIVLGTDDKPKE